MVKHSMETILTPKLRKALLAKYNRLEANNSHNACAKLLVNAFGTDEEKEQMKGIIARFSPEYGISPQDYRLRFEISQKYFHKLTS
jgi:hypothetical protein